MEKFLTKKCETFSHKGVFNNLSTHIFMSHGKRKYELITYGAN